MATIGNVNGNMMINEGAVYGDMVMKNHSKKVNKVFSKLMI